MATINEQEILQALDNDFSPEDIEIEMINQGINQIEANTAIQSVVDTQISELPEQPLETIEPIGIDQLTEPVEPIDIPDPLTPIQFKEFFDEKRNKPAGIFQTLDEIDTAEQRSEETEILKKDESFSDEIIRTKVLSEVENPNSAILENRSQEEIDQLVETLMLRPFSVIDPIMGPQELASKYNNIARKYNTAKVLKSFFGDKQSKEQLAQDSAEVAEFVFQGLKKNGFEMFKVINTGPNQTLIGPDDPRINNVYLNTDLAFRDKDGKIVFITPSIINDFNNSRFEFAGAITGASAGAVAAAQIPIPPITIPTAIAKGLTIGIGTLVGGAAGAFTGRGLDVFFNAWKVKEEIDTIRVLDQMADAAYTDALFATGMGVTVKLAAPVIKGTYNIASSLTRKAFKAFQDVGAFDAKAERALKRLLNLSDGQADEIIREWSKLNALNEESISRAEKLGIIATSLERGGGLISAVGARDTAVANKIAKEVDRRAKELSKVSKELTDPNITRRVTEDLADYASDVNALHANAKQIGSRLIGPKQFEFDYDVILYTPLNKKLSQELQNPAKFDKVDKFVDQVATTSHKRDYKSLLDTRTLIRDFERANLDLDQIQKDVLKNAIVRLDKLIKSEASKVVDGNEWHRNYRKSIIERDKMFDIKDNVLFKAITAKGVTPEKQIKAFVGYIRAEDGTYINLMSKLPKITGDKVEVEIANSLIERFTVGDVTSIQAVRFPQLAEEMSKYPFKSAEAKRLKSVVNMMSNVYKNDIGLANTSGRLHLEAGQQGLTANLFIKGKYEFMSNVYDALTKFKPTKAGAERVLVDKLIKVLENPLDTVSINILMKELATSSGNKEFVQQTVGTSLQNLQVQAIKRGQTGKADIPRTTIFKAAKLGKERTVRNGSLGFGIYYKLDKGRAVNQLTSPLERVTSRKVPDYRIASEELITQLLEPVLAGKVPVAKDLRTHQSFIKKELEANGYLGFKFGEDMVLFN